MKRGYDDATQAGEQQFYDTDGAGAPHKIRIRPQRGLNACSMLQAKNKSVVRHLSMLNMNRPFARVTSSGR